MTSSKNINKGKSFKEAKEDKNERYQTMKEKLKTDYDVDVLEDVILSQPDKIILFADLSDPESIEMEVVSGSLEIIGFKDKPSIKLEELLSYFEYNSGYAKVAGKKTYYANIRNELYDFDNQPDVTFPINNDKGKHWLQLNLIPLQNKNHLAAVFIADVTDVLDSEEALFVKTHHDSLTGLFNKYALDYHYGKRYKKDNFHVLFMDIDNFKRFNDTLGHPEGNTVLVEFADLLRSYESGFNRFYRIGGDEFVGLFFEKPDTIKTIASEIINKTQGLFQKKSSINASVSIGIVKAEERDDVIGKADKVLYRVKENGKNRYLYELESNIEGS